MRAALRRFLLWFLFDAQADAVKVLRVESGDVLVIETPCLISNTERRSIEIDVMAKLGAHVVILDARKVLTHVAKGRR